MTKWLLSGSSPTASQSSATCQTESRTRVEVVGVVGDLVVGDEEVAVVLVLQTQPVLERPGVVPEVQGAGRAACR